MTWVKVIWRRRHDDLRRLLCWDSYRCHLTDKVMAALAQRNMEVAVILGGTIATSLLYRCIFYTAIPAYQYLTSCPLQAPDICWNKPFKAHYQGLYDWMATSDKTYGVICVQNGKFESKNLNLSELVEFLCRFQERKMMLSGA